MAKIVLVDDELTMVQMIAEVLRGEGHEVFPFTSPAGVPEALVERQPDLVITDLYLDKTKPHGMEIIRKARALSPPAVVIMVTGFGTVESAVEAMRLGAYDYLEKPFKLDELKLCVQRALSYTQAVQENTQLRRELRQKYGFSQIIGASARMQEVFRMIERVADTDATVLILGESGDRQGVGGPGAALQFEAEFRAVRSDQLFSVAGEPAGVRVVRASQGGLHGGHRGQERTVPRRGWGNDLPG